MSISFRPPIKVFCVRCGRSPQPLTVMFAKRIRECRCPEFMVPDFVVKYNGYIYKKLSFNDFGYVTEAVLDPRFK